MSVRAHAAVATPRPGELNPIDFAQDAWPSASFGSLAPNLVVLHASGDLEESLGAVAHALRNRFPGCRIVGQTAESVVAMGLELEETSAITSLALALPNAKIEPFHLEFVRTREGHAFSGWPDAEDWSDQLHAILAFGDPFSFPMDAWLERMNEDQPGLPIIGGMCSGGHGPGSSRLLWDDRLLDSGAVFVALGGDFHIRPIVSQGCRAIGATMQVTQARQNVLLELDGIPALQVLHQLFISLPTREQETFRHGLQLGKAVNPSSTSDSTESYVIRNIVGIEPDLQGLVIGDYLESGEQVRFHLRDEQTATADLESLLREAAIQDASAPAAALVFACNGRGSRLFSAPHHDAHSLQKRWPDLPTSGCFAAGEIGPVQSVNFFHGFTASMILFLSESGANPAVPRD